jgi:protein NUD1
MKSSSIASIRRDDQGTIQIRASKEDKQDTPEWKRRLVRGEMSADEQCDLFAPIGLENIFRQPATSEARPSFTVVDHPDDDAQSSMSDNSVRRKVSFKNNHEKETYREKSIHLSVGMASSKFGLDGALDAGIRLRSASGEEELRNEDLTPIFLSASNNTVDRRTGSGILQSALRQLNGMSDSSQKHESDVTKEHQENGEASAFQPNELLDVSSPYMPEDLSTGTQEEEIPTQPFVTFERGGYSEGSFRLRQLSTSSFPSHLQSSVLTNSKIRSSPPASDQGGSPLSPEDSIVVPAVTFSPAGEPDSERPQTANMSSPLKLFGNHDTFTNKKLLRRMSQFEETFQDISEDDEPASPSLVARRARTTKRSLPNLRRGQPQAQRDNARPVTQDAADPRMNRFGYGQLDEFDFADKLVEPSAVPSLSFQHTSLREYQHGRRLSSRNVQNDNLRKAKSFDDLPETNLSTRVLQRRISRRSGSRQSSLGVYYQSNPNVRRVTNMSSRTTAPKRRRTIQQSEEQALDATELIDSILNLSIEEKSQIYDHVSNSIQDSPDSEQTRTRWNRVASENALSISDESKEDVLSMDGHKRSLTTQDFLDEATKVMSIIRAKSKYKNGLASVEESDVTGLDDEEDEALTDVSSRENLSRPPSREGVDMRKFREPRPLHPRVVSHLKKFADKEDTEQLMASVMSDLYKEHNSVTGGKLDYSALSGETMSSPQNVRILPQRKRKHSDDESPMHSIPTISSNGSNTKGVIASDMVSHLIPEHVNGMNYDKANKAWVKQRIGRAAGIIRNEDSEDDPFGSIPDLSVDELEEIKRVQESASPSKNSQAVDNQQAVSANNEEGVGFAGAQRPVTRDGAPFIPDSSSVQSKTTRFTSSGPQPETRATSWGTEDMTVNINQIPSPNSAKAKIQTTLQQGHKAAQSKQSKGSSGKRVSTISFSSPLVSHISYADEVGYVKTSETTADEKHDEQRIDSKVFTVAPSRRTSFDGRPFVGRPISRIDEQNEDSIVEMRLNRRNSTGPVVSTPPSHLLEKSIVYPPSAGGDNYSFYLSPLADFTVHQTDNPKHPELSYVAQRVHPTALRQIHGTFSLATEDLIRHITDVEPTEPYWEHLRRLSLRDKGIITLHYLDKFCPRLEELDVSENELGQLDGAPSTLRDLRVQHNCLTNMTAWGHLINLQYLDVSGNQLETLDSFSGLIHLRELRANNNRIRNIKGIFGLNGLLRLEMRHNNLTTVDFEGSEL